MSFLAAGALAISAGNAMGLAPSVVTVERTDGGYQLIKNGEPYVIHGAGGTESLELLKQYGGNTVRTWDAEGIGPLMDEAEELGLSVWVGIWIAHQRHGYDHSDPAQRQAQLDRVERFVREFRDHPALLGWGVGNELELEGDLDIAIEQIREASALIKKLDPNHPTAAIVADIHGGKARKVRRMCPDIDILGVNSYSGMGLIPERLEEQRDNGPYMVTEFGPVGHWETESSSWGAPYEQTSSAKAAFIAKNFERAVESELDANCLGSFAFLWGNKQEKTETWFGLILPTGETTETVDRLSTYWTGEEPENRAPRVTGLKIADRDRVFAPGERVECSVDSVDPDGDALRVEWRVIPESGVRSVGGDFENSIKPVLTRMEVLGTKRVLLTMPQDEGAYRVFVTVRDGKGHAGTANLPVYVGTP